MVVIEVKSLPLSQIKRFSGCQWELNRAYFGQMSLKPFEQAKAQLQSGMK